MDNLWFDTAAEEVVVGHQIRCDNYSAGCSSVVKLSKEEPSGWWKVEFEDGRQFVVHRRFRFWTREK